MPRIDSVSSVSIAEVHRSASDVPLSLYVYDVKRPLAVAQRVSGALSKHRVADNSDGVVLRMQLHRYLIGKQ